MSRPRDNVPSAKASDDDAFERRLAIRQIVLVWVVLVAKAYLLRFAVLGDVNVIAAVLLEGVFLGALLVVVDAVFPDHRFGALLVTDLMLSMLMLATAVYSAYYGDVPTPALLGLAGQAPAVKDSITGLLNWVHALFFIDIPFFVAGAVALARWRRRRGVPVRHGHFYVRQPVVVFALGIGSLAAALWFGYAVTQLPDPIDGRAASKAEGLFTYQVASAVPRPKVVSAVDLADPAAVQREVDRLRGGTTGKRIVDFPEGAAKGMNVIIIQVEALQANVIDLKVDGQEVTPNLNRLAATSVYYPNAYTQVAFGNTADAEFAANASLYPPVNSAASVIFADKEIPSLPRMMNAAGYESLTFHANTVHFWNRKQLYEALGFTKWFDSEFFGDQDVMGMGPSDEALYKAALPELVRRDRAGGKFLAEFITLSAHRPYDAIPPDRQSIKLPSELRNTLPGNYVIAQNYSDKAIGRFLDDLEKAGLAEKTVVVVFGDHNGLAEDKLDRRSVNAQKAIFGAENNEIDLLNVPLIIHIPGQTTGTRVTDAAGQVDLPPTLADALGLDRTRTPLFGRNLFVRSRVLLGAGRIVSLGAYFDERLLFVPGVGFEDGYSYDIATRKPMAGSEASEEKWRAIRETLKLSESYAGALPRRAGYQKDEESVIPQLPR